MNTNKIATRSTSKRLLAALAVLAVALAAIAAVPVLSDDSDAVSYTDGIIAAGLTNTEDGQSAQAGTNGLVANAIVTAISGSKTPYCDQQTAYVIFYDAITEATTYTITLTEVVASGTPSTVVDTITYKANSSGLHALWFDKDNIGEGSEGTGTGTFDPAKSYSVQLSIDGTAVGSAVTLTAGTTTVYQDLVLKETMALPSTAAETITVVDGASITGTIQTLDGNGDVSSEIVLDEAAAPTGTSGKYSIAVATSAATVSGGISSGTLTVSEGRITFDDTSVGSSAVIAADRGGSIVTSTDKKFTMASGARIVLEADQHQPVTFTSKARDTEVTTTYNNGYSLGLKGSLELTSGALTIDGTDFESMTLTSGTFTIAKDAALLINNGTPESTSSSDLLTVTAGSIVNNGHLALTNNSTTQAPSGIQGITTATAWKALKSEAAYTITQATLGSNTKLDEITVPALGYKGQTIDVTPVLKNDATGYVVSQVGYGTEDLSNNVFTYTGLATANAGYDSYSFRMPGSNIYVSAETSPAYTATFVAVDADGKLLGYQFVSDPYDEKTVVVPAISIDGYSVDGYYKKIDLYNQYATSTSSSASSSYRTITLDDVGNATVYVKMVPLFKITYATVEGGAVSGAVQAKAGSEITVDITIGSGYEYKLASVTVTYADGTVVSATDAEGASVSADTTATFVMPAQAVTVSASFNKLYTFTVYEASDDAPTGTVTITKVGTTDAVAATSNGSLINTDKDAATLSIKGKTITFEVSSVTSNYGISALAFTDSGKGTLELDPVNKYDSTTNKYTVTFEMPGQDVYLAVSYGPVGTLNLIVGEQDNQTYKYAYGTTVAESAGLSITADGLDDTASITNTASSPIIPLDSTVTVTVAPQESYVDDSKNAITFALKSISVTDADGNAVAVQSAGDNEYTFTMRASGYTVTTLYDYAFTIVQVDINSASTVGSVDYKDVVGAYYAPGSEVVFSLTVEKGSKLSGIVASGLIKAPSTTEYQDAYAAAVSATTNTAAVPAYVTIDSKNYTLSWTGSSSNTDSAKATASGTAPAATGTSIFSYDKAAQTVTMIMPAATVGLITFTFSDMTYATVVVTLNGTTQSDYTVYSDAACTKELEDASDSLAGFQVEDGTAVYVKVETPDSDSTVTGANLSYKASASATTTSSRNLTVVSAPAENAYASAIYGFTAESASASSVPVYTVGLKVALSALAQAKLDANTYVQGIQSSDSMSEVVKADATTTWAVRADADVRVFSIALETIASATTLTAVQSAIDTFDANLLSYLKSTTTTDLTTAYDAGSMDSATYRTAVATIGAVVDDNGDSIQNEVDEIIAAYDAAMPDTPEPTPVDPTGVATSLTIGSANNVIMIHGTDGYIPDGTITLWALYTEADGVSQNYIEITLPVNNSEHEDFLSLTVSTEDANASSVFGIVLMEVSLGSVSQSSLTAFTYSACTL